MPVITLSDRRKIYFANYVSSLEVVHNICPEKDKTCVAALVNGELVDATDIIKQDAQLIIITVEDQLSLNIIRKSCVHLLGRAIKQLWPKTKMVKGIITDNGFYYDIDLDYILTLNDLNTLENRMHELAETNYGVIKEEVSLQYIRDIFASREESYKVAILDDNNYSSAKPKIYHHGEYIDICQGPHVPNMSFCHYFSLQKISSVYFQDNIKDKTLQRISGTAWGNKKQLNDYLNNLQEITKRDHRKIGKQLNLYHIQEEAPGMIFWHNDGWIIFRELESFIRTKLKNYCYQEVKGPFMMDRALWEDTGHWDNYAEYMFTTSSENREYCIKPMNCPGHVQIFKQGLKSYRDLPVRIAEFGSCHRNEKSGALHGLMRIRNFTQDDAHIFCTEDQVYNEVNNCIKMIYDIYGTFGFKEILVRLSTRPEKRIGSDDFWDRAEKELADILIKNDINFKYQLNEGAFYGPKIEFTLLDCLGRAWQCGTLQLDFSLPNRLNAFYIGKKNEKIAPVMIHRAILGSIERFIGIITEEYAGFYPTWLAPLQVVIINITDNQLEYVVKLTEKLLESGIRVKADIRNEKVGFKIREHTLRRVPYIFICGDIEVKEGKVSVRTRHGKDLGKIKVNEMIVKLHNEIYSRNLHQLEG